MQQAEFESVTGVSLAALLDFNEKRIARVVGNAPSDEEYRKFVRRRIASIKAQIEAGSGQQGD
jgi:hypothetical protein